MTLTILSLENANTTNSRKIEGFGWNIRYVPGVNLQHSNGAGVREKP